MASVVVAAAPAAAQGHISISELPLFKVDEHGSKSSIHVRSFRLSLNDFDVEISSLGASITKILIPNYAAQKETSSKESTCTRDDVTLFYSSPRTQYAERNAPYFGCIVGRVANRIEGGKFELNQSVRAQDGNSHREELVQYQLDRNNGNNHLHGGCDGFCHRVWDAKINEEGVTFSLLSPADDQSYPGSVMVNVTYKLLSIEEDMTVGARLCISMDASLPPGETKATPINLANHCYFNLDSHGCQNGILDHILELPNSSKYTPLDSHSIPTREVRCVEDAMDFRSGKLLRDALIQYGIDVCGLEESIAKKNVDAAVAMVPDGGGAKGSQLNSGDPYGYDHNYVIDDDVQSPTFSESHLRLAAVLSHPPTGRCLRVSTDSAGVQVYSANFLDGTNPLPSLCKEGASYKQWQGLCLETQAYPNSIFFGKEEDVPEEEKEFARGRCFILRPGQEEYRHRVQYEFSAI